MEISMERRVVGLLAIFLGSILSDFSSQESSILRQRAITRVFGHSDTCPQQYYGDGLPGRLR